MGLARCFAAIASASPPHNTACAPELCARAQSAIDNICRRNGYPRDQPYLLPPTASSSWCYCCCRCCFGYGKDTAIALATGASARVQDLRAGDMILAAGPDLRWRPVPVAIAGGTPFHGGRLVDMVNVVTRRNEIGAGGVPVAHVVQATEDVLFLLSSGTLKPARALVAGDRLRLADGREEEVITSQTSFLWTGDYQVELEPFDGASLEGHLISANTFVTADFSVSLALQSGELMGEGPLDRALFHESTFLDSAESIEEQAGPPPVATFTIPEDAKAFFHADQAADIRANAPMLSRAVTFRVDRTEKLFDLARGVCDDVVMLIDWDNPVPNAYAWSQFRQRFVLMTGGLLRVAPLTEAGLALILVQMLAMHAGAECVGVAADAAINQGLRQLWPHAVFPMMCERGVAEMTMLFAFVKDGHAEEDPRNRCERPSLQCLERIYAAAMALQPLPDCGGSGQRPS
jgi:hypothetical protein